MSHAPRVALTFDAEHPDRPNDGDRTDAILAILADAGIRATFFLQGRWVEAMPDVARAIAAGGHLIGHHSHYHARMPLLSTEGLRDDLATGEAVIREIAGIDPRPWYRAPFGNGAERVDLLEQLAAAGYRHVGWNVAPEEWRPHATAEGVSDAVVDAVGEVGDGAIVLLHSWPSPVVGALRRIIERLRDDGTSFVRVDELDLPDGLTSIADPQPGALAPPVGAN